MSHIDLADVAVDENSVEAVAKVIARCLDRPDETGARLAVAASFLRPPPDASAKTSGSSLQAYLREIVFLEYLAMPPTEGIDEVVAATHRLLEDFSPRSIAASLSPRYSKPSYRRYVFEAMVRRLERRESHTTWRDRNEERGADDVAGRHRDLR